MSMLPLDDELIRLLADIHQIDYDSSPDLDNFVVYRLGSNVSEPATLVHIATKLNDAELSGDTEQARGLRLIVAHIEALRAKDPDELAAFLRVTATFRATMEALNEYVGAPSEEAALDVLRRSQDLLLTDLAEELLDGKVTEIAEDGDPDKARMLARGPLRLLRDAREHGVEMGYKVGMDRYRQCEEAKERLGFLMATMSPECVAALDGVLTATDTVGLATALNRGYDWLTRQEAASALRESVTITATAGDPDEEAAPQIERMEYLLATVERLIAIARQLPGLARTEQVRLALGPATVD